MVLELEANPQTRAGFVFSWPFADEQTTYGAISGGRC